MVAGALARVAVDAIAKQRRGAAHTGATLYPAARATETYIFHRWPDADVDQRGRATVRRVEDEAASAVASGSCRGQINLHPTSVEACDAPRAVRCCAKILGTTLARFHAAKVIVVNLAESAIARWRRHYAVKRARVTAHKVSAVLLLGAEIAAGRLAKHRPAPRVGGLAALETAQQPAVGSDAACAEGPGRTFVPVPEVAPGLARRAVDVRARVWRDIHRYVAGTRRAAVDSSEIEAMTEVGGRPEVDRAGSCIDIRRLMRTGARRPEMKKRSEDDKREDSHGDVVKQLACRALSPRSHMNACSPACHRVPACMRCQSHARHMRPQSESPAAPTKRGRCILRKRDADQWCSPPPAAGAPSVVAFFTRKWTLLNSA